jgi:hypothetical protein
LQFPVPDTGMNFNPMLYKRDVYQAIAICYLNLKDLKQALIAIQTAYRADPNHPDIKLLRQFILSEKQKFEVVDGYLSIAKYLNSPTKIATLLNSVPSSLADNEVIQTLQKHFLPPKVWGENSIVIFCGSSAENWTPDSINKGGIGGSETAVIELSKRLTKQGYDVTVYNQCGAPEGGLEFDGVHYRNFWTFNPKDNFNVFWSWRNTDIFDYDIHARFSLLDLHDVMNPLEFTQERLSKIDRIFVKSNYHRSLLPNIPDEKFVVIGNGIDLARFKGEKKKEPFRFAYTSAPNRGLEPLLEMWPKIREKLPEAELHVYYGWQTFYELNKHNPERMMWMKKNMLNQ